MWDRFTCFVHNFHVFRGFHHSFLFSLATLHFQAHWKHSSLTSQRWTLFDLFSPSVKLVCTCDLKSCAVDLASHHRVQHAKPNSPSWKQIEVNKHKIFRWSALKQNIINKISIKWGTWLLHPPGVPFLANALDITHIDLKSTEISLVEMDINCDQLYVENAR